MFLTLVLLGIGAMLFFNMKTRIAHLERRLESVEDMLGWKAEAAPARVPSLDDRAAAREPPVAVPEEPATAPPAPVRDTVLRIRGRVPAKLDQPPSGPSVDHIEEPYVASPLPHRQFGFEDLFGRKLSIWAGGVTLAVAGMLIVKYSIDIGLLSPLVRVINGLLFGIGLIVGAEAARRREDWTRDPRVPQALAGAGIATLYGSVLVAANVYDLIGPFPALIGMAAVTALAMFLAIRFGAPSALLGLVGGLAAPALVGSGDPNIPLLSLYLALAVGGLCAVSRSQRWLWLGIGALLGGFAWGGLLILGGNLDPAASVSIGTYLILLGVLLPLMIFQGEGRAQLRIGGALVAAAQMAALVAAGGFEPLHWGLFGLISIAVIWLSRREKDLAILPTLGFAIGLLLAIVWPDPPVAHLAAALAGLLLIYGAPALLDLWREKGSVVEAGQIAAAGLAALFVPLLHFYQSGAGLDLRFALIALGAALIPGGSAALGVREPTRSDDSRFALLLTVAAILIGFAVLFALPAWAEGPTVALLATGLLSIAIASRDLRIERSAWAFLLAGLALAVFQLGTADELARMAGSALMATASNSPEPLVALLRWALLCGATAFFAWRADFPYGRAMAQAISVLLGYAALAQIVPADLLPLIPALVFAGLALWARTLPDRRLTPGLCAALTIVIGWALLPLALWFGPALLSITGVPLLVTDLPSLSSAALRLLVPALIIGLALQLARERIGSLAARLALLATAAMAPVGLHILFKQLLAIDGEAAFAALGIVERSLWQALLLAGAVVAWSFADRHPLLLRQAARLLCAAALAHSVYFSLMLHNPLWAEQAVGAAPFLNLLAVIYGLPLAAIWCIGRYEPAAVAEWRPARDIAQMVLILLLGFSLLRQLFHGSLLSVPGVSDAEDILASVLAIALAIGFLVRGIAQGSREWRVGSLILMLAAVAKVFLFDASGLEGLPRILSFVALGFSLIGIGWLYSRFLGEDRTPASEAKA